MHPTASTVITGILGVVLFIEGIVVSVSPTYSGQSNVAGGIFICILGLVALGLAGYAVFDTKYFQIWTRQDGSYGHAVVRYAGPVLLIVALVETIVVLWILSVVWPQVFKK